MAKRIYIAGPAVFHADQGAAYYNHVRKVLGAKNVQPLIPIDNVATGALEIRSKNIEMIEQCDAIIADLSPFRSKEPDCGTAFEVGYGAALKKKIFVFTSDMRPLTEKYGGAKDEEGMSVEDFHLPFNLMLADGTRVFHSFDEAFEYFNEHYNQ